MGEVIAGKGRASWLLESTAAGAEPSGPALSDAEVTRIRGAGSSLAAPNMGLAAFIAATWLASPIVKQRRQQANQTRHPLPTFHRLPRPSSPPRRVCGALRAFVPALLLLSRAAGPVAVIAVVTESPWKSHACLPGFRPGPPTSPLGG